MSNKHKHVSNSEFFNINRLNFNFNPVKVFITKVKIYLKENSYIFRKDRNFHIAILLEIKRLLLKFPQSP